jgi:phospholipid/cholesterol/gamma-HCH transport system permease protein
LPLFQEIFPCRAGEGWNRETVIGDRQADDALRVNHATLLPSGPVVQCEKVHCTASLETVNVAARRAQIYIANLVGIGMVREMGALMTGVIMAGRTGAAFAAQLGTMQVNEEIDAFHTLGISPMDFLVMPRMLALIFVMPLLTLYSDLVGMLAGLFVAATTFDIGTFEYYHQTIHALNLRHFAVGISKGTTYGILIAFAGCLRGMQCGPSAQAVGEATTSAVVTSILFIVIAASLLTIIYQKLGI